MSKNTKPKKKRFAPKKILQILADADKIGAAKAAAKHECHVSSIYVWRGKKKQILKKAA